MSKEEFSFYKEYPKTCHPEDFWGQVKRTINGIPVCQQQIDLIVQAVVEGLQLTRQDTLLDLCCGNGALSTLIFKYCHSGIGVDFSEYLISVAQKNFTQGNRTEYILSDVVEFCEKPMHPENITKLLCYGSFSYLEPCRAKMLLLLLRKNFQNLQRIFIGNCPDKELLSEFIKDRPFVRGSEDDPDSQIGVWRTQEEFSSLAKQCGWQVSFHKMPNFFYASHYRYDVILTNES